MKLIFLAVLLPLFFAYTGFSQNVITDTTATVVAYWEKGDMANFSLTQTKQKYEKQKLVSQGGSTSTIEFKVTDATDESYTIEWKYTNIKVNSKEAQHPIVEKLVKLTQGITFKYWTNEAGEFRELLNWKEVQATVNTAIDQLTVQYKDPQISSISQQTKKVFSSRQSIEELIMKDVQMIHAVYGKEFKLKEKITAATELPNFLGGPPFPSIVNIEMYELNPAQSSCKIELSQNVDKTEAATIIKEWLKKSGQPVNSQADAINISDILNYDFELKKGWVTSLQHTRMSEVGGIKQTETQIVKKIN